MLWSRFPFAQAMRLTLRCQDVAEVKGQQPTPFPVGRGRGKWWGKEEGRMCGFPQCWFKGRKDAVILCKWKFDWGKGSIADPWGIRIKISPRTAWNSPGYAAQVGRRRLLGLGFPRCTQPCSAGPEHELWTCHGTSYHMGVPETQCTDLDLLWRDLGLQPAGVRPR